jgi:hypothetical protein
MKLSVLKQMFTTAGTILKISCTITPRHKLLCGLSVFQLRAVTYTRAFEKNRRLLQGKRRRVFASAFTNIVQTSVQFKIVLTPNWSWWTACSFASAGLGTVCTRQIFLSQRDEMEFACNFDKPPVV